MYVFFIEKNLCDINTTNNKFPALTADLNPPDLVYAPV